MLPILQNNGLNWSYISSIPAESLMFWQEFWVSEAPYYLCLSMVEVFPSKSAIFLLAVSSSLALVI